MKITLHHQLTHPPRQELYYRFKEVARQCKLDQAYKTILDYLRQLSEIFLDNYFRQLSDKNLRQLS